MLGAPAIIVPLAIGTIVAATFAPLVDYLIRRGWQRTLATMVVVGGAFVGALGITILTGGDAPPGGPRDRRGREHRCGGRQRSNGEQLTAVVDVVREAGVFLVLTLSGLTGDLAMIAIIFVLGGLLGFYFIRDGGQVGDVIHRLFPDRRGEELRNIGARSMGVLSGYMVATGVLSAFSAVTQWLIMVLLGLPLALPLAVLSFFGGFIPYIGSFITTGIAFLVTVAVGDPIDILVMGIFTIVFNIVAGSFIGPIVVRPRRQPAPGRRPRRDPGRWRDRRHHRDVPRGAGDRDRVHDLAAGPARARPAERPDACAARAPASPVLATGPPGAAAGPEAELTPAPAAQ